METAGSKSSRELIERGGVDGFGAVKGDAQRGEIERGAFLGGDSAGAETVGKVGAPGGRDFEAREELQPPEGFLEKRGGRHEQTRCPDPKSLHRETDEAHVMEQRQPTANHILGSVTEDAPNHLLVGEELSVRKHDTFRGAGRPRGVLEKRERIGGEVGGPGPTIREIAGDGVSRVKDKALVAERGGRHLL